MAMNKQLEQEVNSIRNSISDQAEKNKLPERFTVENVINKPQMVITDTETGKSSVVSFYAYGQVRETLNDLFGE